MEVYERLEIGWGKWVGLDNVVACSSGTAALHLALEAFRFPLGSEVIIPDFTMIACARAITLAGLKPVFVDCDDRLCMDWRSMKAAITSKTVAVMPVAIYGRVPSVPNYLEAHNAGLIVIEDAAECPHPEELGIHQKLRPDAICWSFYKNKVIAGEEGGAVAFPFDSRLAERARSLRCLGFTDAHDFRHIPRGCNYRLANSLASLILGSLKDVDSNLRFRRGQEEFMNYLCPKEWMMPERDVPWVYDMRLPVIVRDKVVEALNKHQIQARRGFARMSSQDEYFYPWAFNHNTNASKAASEMMYLPLRNSLWDRDEIETAFDVMRTETEKCIQATGRVLES